MKVACLASLLLLTFISFSWGQLSCTNNSFGDNCQYSMFNLVNMKIFVIINLIPYVAMRDNCIVETNGDSKEWKLCLDFEYFDCEDKLVKHS